MTTVYQSKTQAWLQFGGEYYLLNPETSEAYAAHSRVEGRLLAQCQRGEKGELMQQFVAACEHLGIVPYCTWHGVINALGDVGGVAPPFRAWTRDRFEGSSAFSHFRCLTF